MEAALKEKLKILIKKIYKAFEIEEQAHFTNISGKKENFADFIIKALKFIYQTNNENLFEKLIKQVSFYEYSGLGDRMTIINNLKIAIKDFEETELKEKKIEEEKKKYYKSLDDEIKWISGVGERNARFFEKLNIKTARDLLFYFPKEHLDFSKQVKIKDLKAGTDVTITGIIKKISAFQSPKNPNLHIMNITIGDDSGTVSLNRFLAGKSGNFLVQMYKKQYPQGSLVSVSGTVQFDRKTRYQLTNYLIEVLDSDGEESDLNSLGKIIPIYKLTEGLNQRKFRKIIANSLEIFGEMIKESFPLYREDLSDLIELNTAIKEIHFPSSEESLEKAKERLAFDEFMLIQIPFGFKHLENENKKLSEIRRQIQEKKQGLVQKYLESLTFKLTNAQTRVFNDILKDLSKNYPMNRLVQGDVGSGKTVIAMLAMLIAVERGQQAVLMAPTEILAEQHFNKCQSILTELGVCTALLVGSQSISAKREILTGLFNGQIEIVIGTHALIQESVEFKDLGLAVIDEQHRFGVRQREKLKIKGAFDCLFMTATPIPRTLALAMYGDLDLSEIDELPPGRKAIKTKLVSAKERKAVHNFVKEELKKGRQAYIIFPLIDESETLNLKSVIQESEKLKEIYSEYNIGLVHGKLIYEEKEKVMQAFRKNEIQILIGTTVIEVGVDVANATIMIIEDSERFGLAQLHQLRGRVGRGSEQSYCFLFGDPNLERLKIMEETENGFLIAKKDLELRGAGELIGDRQSGITDFALKNLIGRGELLERAKDFARKIIKEDPELNSLSNDFKERLKILRERLQLSYFSH